MPLIRYKVGDRGIWAEDKACKCGMTSRKIARITGRTSNNFPLSNGGYVSGEYLTLTFNHVPGIVNFQIRQKSISEITIFLITNEAYNRTNTEHDISTKMYKLFGTDLNLKFEYVEEIPTTKTGKHLFTVSEINQS